MSHKNYVQEDKKWTGDIDVYKSKANIQSSDFTYRKFEETLEDWRKYCEEWKSYPDKFVDFISDENTKFRLNFFQRIFLRVFFRYNKVFITATRGSSKTYCEILALMLKCVMFPGINLFLCAPGKAQAAKISQEKILELWENYPILKREVKYKSFKDDYTKLIFQNDSKLDIVQMKDSARGGRRHSGGIEEIADEKFDGNMLHSVVIPLMTGSRFTMQRDIDPDELQRNQWYVTTAGTRQSFAFQKLKEILQDMAMGKSAFSLGFDYQLPCMYGLLDIDFVNEQRESPNMTVSAFSREYSSVWTGSSDKSLVSLEDLNKCRTLSKSEEKAINSKDVSYVLAYDVARCEGSANANCALSVIKLVPRGDGTYQKYLVNLFSFEGTHFLEQALFLKQKVNEYNARVLIVDSLGLGKGLVDQLVLDIDDNPPYAVVNDERYKKYRKPDSVDMVFCIQGNAKETKNSNIHNHFMQVIANQKIKLLKPESVKKSELIKDKKRYDPDKLIRELQPFVLTDILCEEIMNLEYKQSGNQTVIKEVSRSIPKDKYSSLSYGLYWIYLLEKKNQMRKKENVLDMTKLKLFRKPKIMSL